MVPESIERILNQVSKQNLSKLSSLIINKSGEYKTIHKTKNLKLNIPKVSLKLLKLDNIVIQKIICLILEIVYESYFFKRRPRFNSIFKIYSLFNDIELKVFWIDEIIRRPCLKVNNLQLCNILNKKIPNNLFINLIYKLLRYDIWQYDQFYPSNIDILNKKIIFSIILWPLCE